MYIEYVLGIIISYLCIRNGVGESGKIAIYTSSAPYILLTLLLIRGLFLDGAWEGLSYLFVLDTSKIFEASVWIDAVS